MNPMYATSKSNNNFPMNINSNNTDKYNRAYWYREIYHSYYDDDYATNYFFNPVTGEFTTSGWTTAFVHGSYEGGEPESSIYTLIDEGIINKDEFLNALLDMYGTPNVPYIWEGGQPLSFDFNIPVRFTGRKYKDQNGYLIRHYSAFRSRYGRVESTTKVFMLEDGTVVVGDLKYEERDGVKDIIIDKLHNMSIRDAVEVIVPFDSSSEWGLFPLVNIDPNVIKDGISTFLEETGKTKLAKQQVKLVEKYQDVLAWANSLPDKSEEEAKQIAERTMCKHYNKYNMSSEEFLSILYSLL